MKFYIVLIASFFLGSAIAGNHGNNKREAQEILMAEHAILTSLLVAISPNGKYICSEKPYACLAPDSAEMGLALIGARNTDLSIKGLASIIRYRIDASISESFTCQILEKGKLIEHTLKTLDTKSLENQCKNDLSEAKIRHKGFFDGISAQAICLNSNEIKEKVQDLLNAIKSKKYCDTLE